MNRMMQEIKDIESDRRGRERHPDKNMWKRVESQMEGVLKSYNAALGYGFVETKNGPYYIHATSFKVDKYINQEIAKKIPDYIIGQKLRIDVVETPNKKRECINAEPIDSEYFIEDYPNYNKCERYELVKFTKEEEVCKKGERWVIPRKTDV